MCKSVGLGEEGGFGFDEVGNVADGDYSEACTSDRWFARVSVLLAYSFTHN